MAEPWVEKLLMLQESDMRAKALRTRKSLIPGEKQSLKEQAAQNRERQNVLKETIFSLETAIKKAESESAALDEDVRKLQQQSILIKKNTEYEAMLAQIADKKRRIGDLESLALEDMDAVEEKKKEFRTLARETDAANANLKDEFMELDALSKDIDQELAKLAAARPELEKAINSDILARYNSLLKKGEDEPLSRVENGICSHCHLRITAQTLNECSKGAAVGCDNCMHLIYLA